MDAGLIEHKVGAPDQSIVADYTEVVVPESAKRSNLRVFLLFMSLQLVFGAVLVPAKLSRRPDLGSGLFMANTTAAALVSENKALSFPASVDSMAVDTTEDHVSMGSVAARKAMAIIANTAHVLAIELVCASQALDLQAPLRASPPITALRDAVRQTVAFTEADRALSEDVKSTAQRILSGEVVAAAEAVLGHELR